MKVSKEQNAQNRDALVAAASGLFQEQGFAATGVAQISERAGLTQGGFYGHFKSKNLLIEAACRQSLQKCHDDWQAMRSTAANGLHAVIDTYVSSEHVDTIAEGCPMAAYTCEMKTQDDAVKHTFTQGFEGMAALLQDMLPEAFADDTARRKALFFMCSMMGSLAMARAIKSTDPQLAEEIVAATRENLKSAANPPGA
ncbi:TetR/AcrR family transcriptional regulator [Pseudomonas sp. NPDC090202]|uniref:TetR/AcrR family transcriptional regulator n=1 Tax=unclassified Pseudomonas TaxID=196821 RepID=UPI00380EF971